MNYTPEQRLARARMALMGHKVWCLYSGLLMLGKLEVDDTTRTAATNGRDVRFGKAFIEKLGDPELRFLLLHENEHKALRQLTTYKFLWDKNVQVCNMAADFMVNIRLMDADAGEGFIKMPTGELKGCFDVKYRGWSTKQVFDDLMQQRDEQAEGGESSKDGAGQKINDYLNGQDSSFDEHDFEGAADMDAEEQEALKKEIETAIRQGGLLAGKMNGNNSRLLDDVLEHQIRWQEILAEFVKSVTQGRDNSSWAKVNRRWVARGLYLPSAVSEAVGPLLVGIDASGSTWSGNQLEEFVAELIGICQECQPEKVSVVWWDTQVQSVQEFMPEQYATMKLELEIKGGGGTSPSCVTDWLLEQKAEYVAAIMLSDGLVGNDWGDWGALPVLWCLNQRGITAGVGTTLYIKETN